MLKDLKIGVRLGIGFGLMLAIFLFVCFFIVDRMDRIAQLTNDLYNHPFAVSNALLRIDANTVRMHRSMKDVVLSENERELQEVLHTIDGYEQEVYNDFEIVRQQFLGDKQLYLDALAIFREWKPIRERAIRLMSEGKRAQAVAMTKHEGASHVKKLLEAKKKLIDFAQNKAQAFMKNTEDTKTYSMIVIFIIIVIASGTVLFLSITLTRGITGPLAKLMMAVTAIGQGRLDVEIEAGGMDELGKLTTLFRQMQSNLREFVEQSRTSTQNLDSTISEILASIQQQASSIREQAASVQETSTTMEEVSQSGSQISERAKQVAQSSEATSAASNSGIQAVEESNLTMEAIREQVEQVAENIVALSEKTQVIGEIIATVNDIAEQSNLLALNASIEAVSAGEQGERFSVVAGEIKNLADQAKESTVQVRNILGEIQKGINASVMSTEEAVKRVEMGKQKTSLASGIISRLSDTIQNSIQAFQQITAGANQQQIGIEQISGALKNMRQASEQTSEGVNQIEKAASSLGALSRQSREIFERYKL